MASSFSFSVQRSETVLVTPAEPTPHEFKHLSDIDDQETFRMQSSFIQYYRNEPSMNGKDPATVIKQALSKALVFYYPFAGRVREGPRRKLAVECTGEGVLFIEADANIRLAQFGDRLAPPHPWLEKLLYNVPGSEGIIGCPLLLIQVTRLTCGDFILALRINHTMADGMGMVQFLTAVGEIARGASAPTIQPVWARDRLITGTLPKPKNHGPKINLITPDHLEYRSFFFGPKEISALKQQLTCKSTTFNVLAACMWRSQTIALRVDEEEEVHFMFVSSARSKIKPPLPDGYYGNVFICPAVSSMAGELCQRNLSYAVELINKASSRKMMDDFCSTSLSDWILTKIRPPLAMFAGHQRVYFVSDNRHIRYDQVDYGWGKAVYACPTAAKGFEATCAQCFYVSFKNSMGEDGVVVPVCLPGNAMERFVSEVEKLTHSPLRELHKDIKASL